MEISQWITGLASAAWPTPIDENEVGDDEATLPEGHNQPVDQLVVEIDYVDGRGVKTHRPFVARTVIGGMSINYLEGICLLRRAPRTLRIDRIEGITTQQGEFMSATDFLERRLGVDVGRGVSDLRGEIIRRSSYPDDVRVLLRPQLSLLVVAARSDGHLHREELDRILLYAERALFAADRAGCLPVALSLEMMDEVERAVRAMLPLPELVPEYVACVEALGSADRSEFWRTFCDVINADGSVSPQERQLLDQIEALQMKS